MSDDDWEKEADETIAKGDESDNWEKEAEGFDGDKPVDSDSDDDWDKEKGPSKAELERKRLEDEEKERQRELRQAADAKKEALKLQALEQAPLEDAAAEKKRQMELQLKADEELAADMFSGFTVGERGQANLKTSEGISPKSNLTDKSFQKGTPLKTQVSTVSSATTVPPQSSKVDPATLDEADGFYNDFHLESTADCTKLMTKVLEKVTSVEQKAHLKGVWGHFLTKMLQLTCKDPKEGILREANGKLRQLEMVEEAAASSSSAKEDSAEKKEDPNANLRPLSDEEAVELKRLDRLQKSGVNKACKVVSLKELLELQTKLKEIARLKKIDETKKTDGIQKKTHEVNKHTKFDAAGAIDEMDYIDDEDWAEEDWGEGEWVDGEWTGE